MDNKEFKDIVVELLILIGITVTVLTVYFGSIYYSLLQGYL
jgi:hypothetical protein